MNTLTIAPLEWSNLKDIDDVEPINDRDTDCLAEIRGVLKKHGKLERFGVALLHSHFDLANDEIMLESSDEKNRTLMIKPIKESEAGDNNVGTIWMLQEGDAKAMAWCRRYCKKGFWGHSESHNSVPGK